MRDTILTLTLITALLLSCSCETTEVQPADEGYLSVTVTDERDSLIQNIEIFIVPDSSSVKTDANGKAFFILETGDYFVDASICCIGPGFFNYHEPVTIEKNDTVKLEFEGCTACN